jgi:hypothetical protein
MQLISLMALSKVVGEEMCAKRQGALDHKAEIDP